MKKILFLLFVCFLSYSCQKPENSYTIQGDVPDGTHEGQTIYMARLEGRTLTYLDSTTIKKSTFTFEGTQDSAIIRTLCFAPGKQTTQTPLLFFVLEPGAIKVSIHEHGSLSGTQLNDRLQGIRDQLSHYGQAQEKIEAQYREAVKDTAFSTSQETALKQQYDSLTNSRKNCISRFVQENRNNVTGAHLLHQYRFDLDSRIRRKLLQQLAPQFKNLPDIVSMETMQQETDSLYSGNYFLDLHMQTPNSNNMNLADVKDGERYTLLMFWASWSSPCRRILPDVVEYYSKERQTELQIIGISLDTCHKDWTDLRTRMQTSWLDLSDLKGWNTEAVDCYGIDRIPSFVLLDKTGKVMGLPSDLETIKTKLATLIVLPEKVKKPFWTRADTIRNRTKTGIRQTGLN